MLERFSGDAHCKGIRWEKESFLLCCFSVYVCLSIPSAYQFSSCGTIKRVTYYSQRSKIIIPVFKRW